MAYADTKLLAYTRRFYGRLLELRQPGGGGGVGVGVSAGRPAHASQPASHLANHHCFVHACLPHHPCSQDLKMMSPIHGVCGKIVW